METVRLGNTEDQNGKRRDSRLEWNRLMSSDILVIGDADEVGDGGRDVGDGARESSTSMQSLFICRNCFSSDATSNSSVISSGRAGSFTVLRRSSVDALGLLGG